MWLLRSAPFRPSDESERIERSARAPFLWLGVISLLKAMSGESPHGCALQIQIVRRVECRRIDRARLGEVVVAKAPSDRPPVAVSRRRC